MLVGRDSVAERKNREERDISEKEEGCSVTEQIEEGKGCHSKSDSSQREGERECHSKSISREGNEKKIGSERMSLRFDFLWQRL
jgi:hypothetical protein